MFIVLKVITSLRPFVTPRRAEATRAVPQAHSLLEHAVSPLYPHGHRRSATDCRLASTVMVLALGLLAPIEYGCAGFPDAAPMSSVVVENRYAPTPDRALVVYDAHWLNVSFQGQPVPPGASSDPQVAVPASADNAAYVVLAPGLDPTSTTPPTTFVVLQSRSGYALALGDTLTIPIDDVGFEGNCAAGSRLTQEQADFLTQIVFAGDFAGLQYDASTCTTTPMGNAGAD